MDEITSLQNPRVKLAVRLRDRRGREQQGRILIDGAREIGRALASGIRPVEAFVCPERLHTVEARQVADVLDASVAHRVSPAVFERLAFGERAEGVLAIAVPPQLALPDLELPHDPLVVVLAGLEKPGNVGAVLRSADGAGAAAVIVADGRTDLYNPNCIRASLGTVFTLPVCQASTSETLAWLERTNLSVHAARVDGADYRQVKFGRRAAIVLGSEATGLAAEWTSSNLHPVRLPMLGAADSLNVSAAAAVLLYEALRQRTAAG